MGLWVGENKGTELWMNVLTSLENRGLQGILVACVDGLKGFPDAVAALYPKIDVQLCIVHMVRNSLRYVSWKEREAVANDLRSIYTAPTVEAAGMALEAFAQKWDARVSSISQSWRSRWDNVAPFFAYPPEIRKVIYTTTAVESINAALRRVTTKRGAFSTQDSARKVLHLAILKASERWGRQVKDWNAVLNHIAIVFEGRVVR